VDPANPFRPSAAADLWEHASGLPVVDTHEHLRPPSALSLPMTPGRLLATSYLTRNLRVSDGSPNGEGANLEVNLETATWSTIEPYVRSVSSTSYYHWLMRGLAALYDLEEPRLTASTWDRLSDELPARYGDAGWLSAGMDRAGIEAVIWDPFWHPGQWWAEDPRLIPSLRVDSFLVAFHPGALDHDDNNLVRDWAERFDIDVTRLADVEQLIDALIRENVAAGARSLKFAFAYDRTLAIGPADRALAETAMGKPASLVRPEAQQAFGDVVVRHMLERAADLGLVVQVHTGMGRLSGSNPMLLDPLLAEHPRVTFDLFHGGYPWTRESAALAHQHPNARLNLTWLPQLTSEATVGIVKEWLQVVPRARRISWGGDCQSIEETYGALLAFRWATSRALGELVDEGYLALDEAMGVAEDLQAAGGREIYGLPTPR
jgi:hypothetical protein